MYVLSKRNKAVLKLIVFSLMSYPQQHFILNRKDCALNIRPFYWRWVFLQMGMSIILSMHLFYAHSVILSAGLTYLFSLYVLFGLFHVLCCECLVYCLVIILKFC